MGTWAVNAGAEANVFAEQAEHARRRDVALAAALAIADMDPHSREDLGCYLKSLNEAKLAGDESAVRYILEAIAELFFPADPGNGPEADEWAGERASEPAVQHARSAVESWDRTFMTRYHALKARAGLETQQQVADRCGLSLNTVNAIETQKVRPQSRTLQKIAKGLGVELSALLDGRERGGE